MTWADVIKVSVPLLAGIITGAVPFEGLLGVALLAFAVALAWVGGKRVESTRDVSLAEKNRQTFLDAIRSLPTLPINGEVTIVCGDLKLLIAKLAVKNPTPPSDSPNRPPASESILGSRSNPTPTRELPRSTHSSDAA